MPSRPAVVAVVLFWLGTVGYLGYTRVWPWLTAAGAPAVTVSATDEAGRVKTRWTVTFNRQKAGVLTTELKADESDRYTFLAKYSDLKFEIAGVPVRVPTATTEVTVDRAGNLRRQSVSGSAVFDGKKLFGAEIPASATVTSNVTDGELRGRVAGEIPGLFKLDPTDLPPVPVPSGQVLNPMLPVNRLSGVTPGARWTIRRVDPLGDSLRQLFSALLAKHGLDSKMLGGGGGDEELLAEVLAEAEDVPVRRGEEAVRCWVIAYRGKDDKEAARTWVGAADGRVMRQQATAAGNTLRLDRDE